MWLYWSLRKPSSMRCAKASGSCRARDGDRHSRKSRSRFSTTENASWMEQPHLPRINNSGWGEITSLHRPAKLGTSLRFRRVEPWPHFSRAATGWMSATRFVPVFQKHDEQLLFNLEWARHGMSADSGKAYA